MGRRVLLILGLTVLAAGCTAAGQTPPTGGDDPHLHMPCAECHTDALPGEALAGVPDDACTACHSEGGPSELTLGAVTFPHRNHPPDSAVEMGCAGCHAHEEGLEPIDAGLYACSLCHLNPQAVADEAGECRLCHVQPAHEGVTSQGLPLPHQGLPWIDGACARCHYDVAEVDLGVSQATCARCHAADEPGLQDTDEDLHGAHTAVGCLSCHEAESHRIRAMSSAVNLECSDCHIEVHDLRVVEQFASPATCNECHGGVHVEQQRLVLGQVPGLDPAQPSEKFMDGLTCRSCHVPTNAIRRDPTLAVRGNADGCESCHRNEYGDVLAWWRQGTRERQALVERTLQRALTDLGERGELDEARTLLGVVQTGRAPHNLRLSHRLFQGALDAVSTAYDAAGRSTPALPELGTEPSMGLCSYCHYRVDEPWLFEEMSGPFHESIGSGR